MGVESIIGAVAGPLIGGMLGSDAAGDAAQTQAAAADRASAVQEAAHLQQRQDLSPWTQQGGLAQNELSRRLGLGGNRLNTGGVVNNPVTAEQLRSQLVGQYTSAAQPIYDPQQNYESGRGWANGQLVPTGFSQGGVDEAGLQAAINSRLAQQSQTQAQNQGVDDGQYGSLTKPFDQTDLNNDLVYQNSLQFGLNTGINQLNNRAAATGGYGSGAALKALTRYGNDYATTKTAGAYDRNAANKNQIYSFLQGQSAQGQSAASGVGAAGINTAAGIAGNINAAGNANAAGSIAGANALGGGIAGATNALQWNQMLQRNGSGNSYTPTVYDGGYSVGQGSAYGGNRAGL